MSVWFDPITGRLFSDAPRPKPAHIEARHTCGRLLLRVNVGTPKAPIWRSVCVRCAVFIQES